MSTNEQYQLLLDACPDQNCHLWHIVHAMKRSFEHSSRQLDYPIIKSFDGKSFKVDRFGLVGTKRLQLVIDRPVEIEIEFTLNLFAALEFGKANGRSVWFRGSGVLAAMNASPPLVGAGAFCVACFQLGIPIKPNFRIQLDESVDIPEPNFRLKLPAAWFERTIREAL